MVFFVSAATNQTKEKKNTAQCYLNIQADSFSSPVPAKDHYVSTLHKQLIQFVQTRLHSLGTFFYELSAVCSLFSTN